MMIFVCPTSFPSIWDPSTTQVHHIFFYNPVFCAPNPLEANGLFYSRFPQYIRSDQAPPPFHSFGDLSPRVGPACRPQRFGTASSAPVWIVFFVCPNALALSLEVFGPLAFSPSPVIYLNNSTSRVSAFLFFAVRLFSRQGSTFHSSQRAVALRRFALVKLFFLFWSLPSLFGPFTTELAPPASYSPSSCPAECPTPFPKELVFFFYHKPIAVSSV